MTVLTGSGAVTFDEEHTIGRKIAKSVRLEARFAGGRVEHVPGEQSATDPADHTPFPMKF